MVKLKWIASNFRGKSKIHKNAQDLMDKMEENMERDFRNIEKCDKNVEDSK